MRLLRYNIYLPVIFGFLIFAPIDVSAQVNCGFLSGDYVCGEGVGGQPAIAPQVSIPGILGGAQTVGNGEPFTFPKIDIPSIEDIQGAAYKNAGFSAANFAKQLDRIEDAVNALPPSLQEQAVEKILSGLGSQELVSFLDRPILTTKNGARYFLDKKLSSCAEKVAGLDGLIASGIAGSDAGCRNCDVPVAGSSALVGDFIGDDGKIKPGTEGKKFNPGHYMRITERHNHEDRMNQINQYVDMPEFDGFTVMFDWKDLEPEQGQYDFSELEQTLDYLSSQGKTMQLMLHDRSFAQDDCASSAAPQYIQDMGGTYVDKNNRCMTKLYDDEIMDHKIALLQEIGKNFNDHPALTTVLSGETALAAPKDGNYNREAYRDNLIRALDETNAYYKNTVVQLDVNYIAGGDEALQELGDAIVRNGASLGWPDALPGQETPGQKLATEIGDQILLNPSAQTAKMEFDDTQTVFDYYVHDLGANQIIWNPHFTSYDDGYIPNYVEEQVLPTIRSNGGTNTTCPPLLGTCLVSEVDPNASQVVPGCPTDKSLGGSDNSSGAASCGAPGTIDKVSAPVADAIAAPDIVVSNVAELGNALKNYKPGDTILLKDGNYNLAGLTYDLDRPVNLVGENLGGTTISNAGGFDMTSSDLMIGNITFDGWDGSLFKLGPGKQDLQNISFYDSNFTNGAKAITTDHSLEKGSTLDNFTVHNSQFYDLRGGAVGGVHFKEPIEITNASVTNSRFSNLHGKTGQVAAIALGGNGTRNDNSNFYIAGNEISNVSSDLLETDGFGTKVLGIWAFGDNIVVENNKVTDMQFYENRNAIYLKASNSVIRNNRVHNGGSTGMEADIMIKVSKGDRNYNNVIEGNVVTSSNSGAHAGHGIAAYGGTIIRNNTVIKQETKNGRGGIFAPAMGEHVEILDNKIVLAMGGGISAPSAANGETNSNASFVIEGNDVSLLDGDRYTNTRGGTVTEQDNNFCSGQACVPEFSQGDWAENYDVPITLCDSAGT